MARRPAWKTPTQGSDAGRDEQRQFQFHNPRIVFQSSFAAAACPIWSNTGTDERSASSMFDGSGGLNFWKPQVGYTRAVSWSARSSAESTNVVVANSIVATSPL